MTIQLRIRPDYRRSARAQEQCSKQLNGERRVLFSISTLRTRFWKTLEHEVERRFKPASMHRVYKKNTWAPAPKADVDRLAGETDYVLVGRGPGILHFRRRARRSQRIKERRPAVLFVYNHFERAARAQAKGWEFDLRIYVFPIKRRTLRRRKQEKAVKRLRNFRNYASTRIGAGSITMSIPDALKNCSNC